MEQYKGRKFVCKFCSKRFPCGKSLGGHIRTHMNENSVDSDEDEPSKLRLDENGGQSSYGLRENPKKNKRFVDHRQMMALKHQQQHQQQLLCCRECGKGFVSSKALCGHMASHSEKEKILMDSQSDSEASSSPIRRRSKRVVVKHHQKGAFVVGGIINQSNSTSSDASETEPEQQETAFSLMMLSRDSSFKKGHNSVTNSPLGESSDNNSVILETKSSSGEQLKMLNVKNVEVFCKKNNNKLRSNEDNDDILYDSDNSDSGYFQNGPKKSNSDVSVDGFLRNNGFNNKTVLGPGSGFNSSPTQQNRYRKEWFKEGGSRSGSGSGRSSTKYDLTKSKRDFPSYGLKKSKYDFTESVYDSAEYSLETDSCADTNRAIKIYSKSPMVKKPNGTKKKSKGHECPICFRVFKSGQALGGHKRSHFIGNQEHRTLVIQHQVAHDMHTLIDLNLPAPIDE